MVLVYLHITRLQFKVATTMECYYMNIVKAYLESYNKSHMDLQEGIVFRDIE